MTKARELGDNAQNTKPKVIDAKGDLIVGTGSDAADNLAAGASGETLVADSSTSTGLRWQETYAAGKNKIINGNMAIDQRNAGAAVTINSGTAAYAVDRFFGVGQATDGVFTLQRDSSAPAGFTYSTKATVTTADASIGSTQFYLFRHNIEGNQIYDLGWGTAGAKTVALSFWVRSSVTGTFGGSVRNTGTIVSYPFSYSISSADTWEKKTITISGDTSGIWATDASLGIQLSWSLGDGSSRVGTAGSWQAASYSGVTGQTNLISTLNATWYITGVQLEIGSAATAFTLAGGNIAGELAACQRYYQKSYSQGVTVPTNATAAGMVSVASGNLANSDLLCKVTLPVVMRTAPTVTIYSYTTSQTGRISAGNGTDLAASSGNTDWIGDSGFKVLNSSGGTVSQASNGFAFHYAVSAEL